MASGCVIAPLQSVSPQTRDADAGFGAAGAVGAGASVCAGVAGVGVAVLTGPSVAAGVGVAVLTGPASTKAAGTGEGGRRAWHRWQDQRVWTWLKACHR